MNESRRCECGGIASWHYILSRQDGGSATIPRFNLAEGTKCWAPGQGCVGTEPHRLVIT